MVDLEAQGVMHATSSVLTVQFIPSHESTGRMTSAARDRYILALTKCIFVIIIY